MFSSVGLLVAILLGAVSCGRQIGSASRAPIAGVARVGGVVISEQTFAELLHKRGQHQPERFATVEQKQALLDELIRPEAVYAKALASGFAQRPEIAAAVKRLITARFQEEELNKRVKATVTEAEIEDFYRENAATFRSPEAVNAALIILKASDRMTDEKRRQRRTKAQAIRERAAAGEDFRMLALKHSEDQTTRYRGGVTGWLTRESPDWDRAVIDTLFAQEKPGDVASVVETPHQFCVVKLLERRPAQAQPLAQMRDAIRYQLTGAREQQREQSFFAEMEAGLDIEINLPLLEKIAVGPEAEPPSLPGTQTAHARLP
jgi:parvulin-like peptidyl-prolyl isomerase